MIYLNKLGNKLFWNKPSQILALDSNPSPIVPKKLKIKAFKWDSIHFSPWYLRWLIHPLDTSAPYLPLIPPLRAFSVRQYFALFQSNWSRQTKVTFLWIFRSMTFLWNVQPHPQPRPLSMRRRKQKAHSIVGHQYFKLCSM